MAENRGLLLAGIGLATYAGYQLLQKPAVTPTPVPTPGPGPTPTPAPAPQPAAGYRVTATAGLIVRAGPGVGYAARGSVAYQTVVAIDCQTIGDNVNGSRIWDRITYPIAGYVSDWYVSTPNVGSYSPGLGVCPGGIVPPPTPTPTQLPPTGGRGAINQVGAISVGDVISLACAGSNADYVVVNDSGGGYWDPTAAPPGRWIRSGKSKVWVKDYVTFQKLGLSYGAVKIVTPQVAQLIGDVGNIQWQPAVWGQRGYMAAQWNWSRFPPGLQPPGGNSTPPRVNTAPAGYCN